MGYYLMIKEAEGIGVKYLCKCIDNKDHIQYKGSGVFWRKIINKHKCNILTTVLGWYETNEELRIAGEYYSLLYNIVEDRSWANLIPEIGDGGPTTLGSYRAFNVITNEQKVYKNIEDIPEGWQRGCPKWKKSHEGIEKTRQFHLGRKRSEETKANMRIGNIGKNNHPYVTCSSCNKDFTVQNINRHKIKCERDNG